MPNEDNRRRRDGSTAQLSVAELLARREAETQPIPRITDEVRPDQAGPDEQTVRFPHPNLSGTNLSGANLSGHELHITELLRREGRPAEEAVAGGVSVPKLVAMASGGVVLCGSVAFGATQWLSSPDERPLAEVRFDTRPAARSTNSLTADLAAAAAARQQAQAQAPQTREQQAQVQPEVAPTTPSQTAQRAPKPAQQAPKGTTTTTTTTTTQQQAPSTAEQPPASSSTQQTTTTPPSTGTTKPPVSESTTPSTSTPPSSGTSTPPTSGEQGVGIGIGLDLGGVLEPIGGFDFFSPAP